MDDLVYTFVVEMRQRGKDVNDIFRAIADVYESVILEELAIAKQQLKKHGY